MSTNVTWHKTLVGESARRRTLGQNGGVTWFTGLSGSGKSTIAVRVESELIRLGFKAVLLDGDNLRHGLCADLGFSAADRAENIRRIGEAAALIASSGMIGIVSAISPFKEGRDTARAKVDAASGAGTFTEVYVKAALETCASRDPKGLYVKAFAGEIKDFTGVSSPYEVPESPELILDTDTTNFADCVTKVITYLLSDSLASLLPKTLEVAVKAAADAGNEIMKIYDSEFNVDYKNDKSPLTEADRRADALIQERLSVYSPYIKILSEESTDDRSRLNADLCFIVDPLDGTKEFIKRNGEFTVNIGMSFKGETVMGVVYIPVTRTLYYAAKGYGAYKVDLNEKYPELFNPDDRIQVSERTDNLIAMKSRSHAGDSLESLYERNKSRIAKEISSGSSLKGCMIAEGMADIYYRTNPTMEWDTCAMQCVVEEAGGIFCQGDGSAMTYNREDSKNGKGFYILNRIESKLV
ncbi:hypothetical protein FACS1894219_07660 [Clostridia bacterium]|nr:hypothetical protein FACS1894219_07660 [Clostridia bacterium]